MYNFKLKNKEYICWLVLIIFSGLSTLKMASFCLSGGILNPDVSLYLISGLKYSGMDFYNIARPEELFYTPVISFLTSLLFRLGIVDKFAIIFVTSIFCFFSYIGLYFLLKLRFNSLLSLTGVIIYGSTSIIIFNLSKGLIDIPSIAVSIWALYFAIRAIDENPKFFLFSFPLLVIGFFTKYISGFILPLIFLYYMMNKNVIAKVDMLISDRDLLKTKVFEYFSSSEFKLIVISLIISLILFFIICKTLILNYGGYLTFFEQSVGTINLYNSNANSAFSPNKLFYFKEFPNILFEKRDFGMLLAGFLYSIFGIAIIFHLRNLIKNKEVFKEYDELFKTKHFTKVLIILLIFSLIGVLYGFKILENNMVSNISFLIAITIIHSILKKFLDNDKCLKITLLFFSYFMIYFIFLSLFPLKLYRYSLPLIPPFVCIIVWSFDSIFGALDNNFKVKCQFKKNYLKRYNYILIFIMVIFLVSTISFMLPMEYERSNHVYQEVLYKGYSDDLSDACKYIMETDADYHSKTFAAFPNSIRTVMWYLKVNGTLIDDDNVDLKNYDNATYLILYKDLKFDNYHKIHNCGDFNIYYHN